MKRQPTPQEMDALASMRDELLDEDRARWSHHPAILYLNELLGPDRPPFDPDDYMKSLLGPEHEVPVPLPAPIVDQDPDDEDGSQS